MFQKIAMLVGLIIVVGIAYWTISPLWNNVVLDEQLPGASTTNIPDKLTTMNDTTRTEFETQTKQMRKVVMTKTEAMPDDGTTVLARGTLIARAHEVEGSALMVKSGSEAFLRFENLKTINGPDLRIYLSADLGVEDSVDLGPIRATEGNVNYPIPAGTDLDRYPNVLIWCRAFSVLFSYAQVD